MNQNDIDYSLTLCTPNIVHNATLNMLIVLKYLLTDTVSYFNFVSFKII